MNTNTVYNNRANFNKQEMIVSVAENAVAWI